MPSIRTRNFKAANQHLSIATGTSLDALYTASYITPHPGMERSASDTFLFQRCRERQKRQREEERVDLLQSHDTDNDSNQDKRQNLSFLMLFCLTLCMSGVQFTCNHYYYIIITKLQWYKNDVYALF